MVKLVTIQPLTRQRNIGIAKEIIKISADFDAPLDDFDDYQ